MGGGDLCPACLQDNAAQSLCSAPHSVRTLAARLAVGDRPPEGAAASHPTRGHLVGLWPQSK